MAKKVKKGDKVHVHGRTCTVRATHGSSFDVTCGPPTGKKHKGARKGKKGRKGGKRRGLGEAINDFDAKEFNKPPKGPNKGAMARAKKRLNDAIHYTRAVLADEKREGRKDARGQVLDMFYAEEIARPARAKKSRTVYSRADPRFHPGIAGAKRR